MLANRSERSDRSRPASVAIHQRLSNGSVNPATRSRCPRCSGRRGRLRIRTRSGSITAKQPSASASARAERLLSRSATCGQGAARSPRLRRPRLPAILRPATKSESDRPPSGARVGERFAPANDLASLGQDHATTEGELFVAKCARVDALIADSGAREAPMQTDPSTHAPVSWKGTQ